MEIPVQALDSPQKDEMCDAKIGKKNKKVRKKVPCMVTKML